MNQLTKRCISARCHTKIHDFKEGLYLCKQLLHYLLLNSYEANEALSFQKRLFISFRHQQHAVYLMSSVRVWFYCTGTRKYLMCFASKHQFLSLPVDIYCS